MLDKVFVIIFCNNPFKRLVVNRFNRSESYLALMKRLKSIRKSNLLFAKQYA